jgi:hypothetical protein
MQIGTCADCKYWQSIDEYGSCRRHAPKPALHQTEDGDAPSYVGIWPQTSEEEWCGDYLENRS